MIPCKDGCFLTWVLPCSMRPAGLTSGFMRRRGHYKQTPLFFAASWSKSQRRIPMLFIWNCQTAQAGRPGQNALTPLNKKYPLGVIANHGKDTAKQLGLDTYFTVYTASEAAGCKKPDPRIFQMALTQANCDPKNAIMIGDRLDNDIYPAKKLGMQTIWIKQGFGGMTTPPSEEYTADFEVASLPELLRIL